VYIATNAEILNRLDEAVAQARRSFYRLVLLVGPSGTGKTAILRQLAELQTCRYLNVNLHLSQRMLEMARGKRPRQVDRIFNALVDEHRPDLPGVDLLCVDLLCVDNLEMLSDYTSSGLGVSHQGRALATARRR
jgi:ATP-dependent protease Clp ATPase subunit